MELLIMGSPDAVSASTMLLDGYVTWSLRKEKSRLQGAYFVNSYNMSRWVKSGN
jgi:hypothetical protein